MTDGINYPDIELIEKELIEKELLKKPFVPPASTAMIRDVLDRDR